MGKLAEYKNGNAHITLYEDGTREIEWPDGEVLNVDFPLSMDLKITNRCDQGCPMCHENSVPDGLHGDILNTEFLYKLHLGTELAIGGGKVTMHPDLNEFLIRMKNQGVVCSMTVHQDEYKEKENFINQLINSKLIYGLGVSFSTFNDELFDKLSQFPNVVIHLIAGIHDKKVFDYLSKWNFKILVLGYKHFRRGNTLYETNSEIIDEKIMWLKNNLNNIISNFRVVSFDNLALEQLAVKDILTQKQWNTFYQGDDGTITMYVDLPNKEYAKTSTSYDRYEITDNIEEMFVNIKLIK